MVHTSDGQREAVLCFLEDEKNFNLIEGKTQQSMSSVIAGAVLKKCHAYGNLAEHVNKKCPGSNWDKKIAESRYIACR